MARLVLSPLLRQWWALLQLLSAPAASVATALPSPGCTGLLATILMGEELCSEELCFPAAVSQRGVGGSREQFCALARDKFGHRNPARPRSFPSSPRGWFEASRPTLRAVQSLPLCGVFETSLPSLLRAAAPVLPPCCRPPACRWSSTSTT